MSTAIDYSYHKVSPHRGAHRIWIENLLLERADFIAGATYTIEINSESRTCLLKLSESGETLPGHKKVSAATTGTPIVYICNKTISEVFGDHEKVMVEYFRKAIRISLHHVSKLSAERVKRFKSNLSKGTLDEGTFCFGVGMAALGLHEGFQRQGINIRSRWVLDREVKFLNAAIRNNPIIDQQTSMVCGSMEEVKTDTLCPVDIFQVSMSCKVHSPGSRSKQKRDVAEKHEDSSGIYGVFKVLEHINPAIFISENVKEARNSASFVILKSVLQKLGYKTFEFILDNEQSGSFEKRPRYWLVAVDQNLPDALAEAIPHYQRRFSTFAEVQAAAPNNTDYAWRTPTIRQKEKILRDAEKGNGFSNTPMLTPESTSCPVIRADYLKAGSTDVRVSGHNEQYRMLTKEEHCLMKSSPLFLINGLSESAAHYVLGQGVDMGQARGLAEMIAFCIKHESKASNSSQNIQQSLF